MYSCVFKNDFLEEYILIRFFLIFCLILLVCVGLEEIVVKKKNLDKINKFLFLILFFLV